MIDSWWDLGESYGHDGSTLALWRVACAFCGEKGNFEGVFHAEKKKPNSEKRLNFDVYKCVNCAGFVHIVWSASESALRGISHRGIHSFQTLPWYMDAKPEPSENWPEGMKRFWIQAHDSLTSENWDAANLMARSAVQFVVRHEKAVGTRLKGQIDNLVSKGILHPLMGDWVHEVRELANESAHPEAPVPEEATNAAHSSGFVEQPQYEKLFEKAGEPWLRGILALAYTYGFRKSELLQMRCKQVDLLNDTVSLYSGETKNGEPRIVALTDECRLLLTDLRKGKQPEDFLFTRENGEPVRDLRGAWDALVAAAGLPGLLLHDFRRSAVRNMIRRGVPQKVARDISGHKTDAVFSRYNIVSEADIRDAARKIEAGAKAVIQSSFTVAQECSNSEDTAESEDARKPS